MPWELDSDRPIYAQIVDRLKHEIVSGFYPPGSRLPSVRDLAAQASVNPNTMQKAFTEHKNDLVFMDFIIDPGANVFPMVAAGKGLTEMILAEEL